jgi:hypothetical protein
MHSNAHRVDKLPRPICSYETVTGPRISVVKRHCRWLGCSQGGVT